MNGNHAIFEFNGISKQFFGIHALKDVSLPLREGRILGLIGENGAGKSTLMNIIGGVTPADEGQMLLGGEPYEPRNAREATDNGIEFIHQELNLFTNLTVAENIFLDSFPKAGRTFFISKRELARRTETLLGQLGIEVAATAPVGTLSPGERQLVEIAKSLAGTGRIFLFDEPTTSLTAKETAKLFSLLRKLRQEGKAIVYISHILGDVREVADDIAVLRDGELVGYGPTEEFPINKMISLMVGREFENIYPPRTSVPESQRVLRVSGLSQTGIVRDINMELHRGEILGVFGLMGSGRTELVRMVFGLDAYEEGDVVVGDEPLRRGDPEHSIHAGLSFVTENRREEGLLMNSAIAENIGLVSLSDFVRRFSRILDSKRMYDSASRVAESLRIKSGSIQRHPAKSLSGGNQQKVVIGKWLMRKPSVLIMDEPTRGIDVGAKYEVYGIMNELAAQGSGILFVSSEIEELMGMCDRIVVMSRGEVMREFSRDEFSQEQIMRAAFRQSADSPDSEPAESAAEGGI